MGEEVGLGQGRPLKHLKVHRYGCFPLQEVSHHDHSHDKRGCNMAMLWESHPQFNIE